MSDTKLQNKPVIAQYLERYSDQIASALPRHMDPDRMARIVMTEIRKTPKLLKCDPKSLFGAVIQASQIGLEPGGALGHCYLIPYGNDVQLIIGYRGMIDLARRSGQIISIEARCVYEGDEFSFSFGLNPDLKHSPCTDVNERGEVTHYYAVARLVGGGVQWDVMSVAEVNEIRDGSQGYQMALKYSKSSPWMTHPIEMGKKTVVRRLFKFLPVSIEIQTAIGLDEQADAGVQQGNGAVIDGDFTTFDDLDNSPAPETKIDSVKEKLRDKALPPDNVDLETGEVLDTVPTGFSEEDVLLLINNADDSDSLDAACDLIRDLPAGPAKKARSAAAKKRKSLEGEK